MMSSERENEDYGLGYQNTLVSILFRSLSIQDSSDIKSNLKASPKRIDVQTRENEAGAYAKPLLRSRVKRTLFVKLKSRGFRAPRSPRGISNANFRLLLRENTIHAWPRLKTHRCVKHPAIGIILNVIRYLMYMRHEFFRIYAVYSRTRRRCACGDSRFLFPYH